MTDVILRPYRPSDAPWLTDAHGRLYAEAEGFDDSFGALVGQILADFGAGHDPAREAGWIAETAPRTDRETGKTGTGTGTGNGTDTRSGTDPGGRPLGSIFCVRLDETTAKLRLFLLLPEARGKGLGRRLLTTCLTFAARAGYDRLTLWTHESHRAACALYARSGFALTDSRPVRSFGQDLVEQTWEIDLRDLAIADAGR